MLNFNIYIYIYWLHFYKFSEIYLLTKGLCLVEEERRRRRGKQGKQEGGAIAPTWATIINLKISNCNAFWSFLQDDHWNGSVTEANVPWILSNCHLRQTRVQLVLIYTKFIEKRGYCNCSVYTCGLLLNFSY